jgi:hypothetical protein
MPVYTSECPCCGPQGPQGPQQTCCPNAIPSTLHVDVDFDCDNSVHVAGTINFNPRSGMWDGFLGLTSGPTECFGPPPISVAFILRCFNDTWYANVQCPDGTMSGFKIINTGGGFVNCDPFLADNGSLPVNCNNPDDACCPGGTPFASITVTE